MDLHDNEALREMLREIISLTESHRRPPSLADVAAAMGLSETTVSIRTRELKALGYLDDQPRAGLVARRNENGAPLTWGLKRSRK